MKDEHTYDGKWPEKVIQRSFIKEHSFVNRLYVKKLVIYKEGAWGKTYQFSSFCTIKYGEYNTHVYNAFKFVTILYETKKSHKKPNLRQNNDKKGLGNNTVTNQKHF